MNRVTGPTIDMYENNPKFGKNVNQRCYFVIRTHFKNNL